MNNILRAALALAAGYVVALLACYFLGAYGVKRHHIESASFIFAGIVLVRTFSLTASSPAISNRGGLAIAGAVALAGAAAYWRALGVGFLSDDYVLRSWVLEGHLSWVNSQFTRPVALAIWRALLALGGGAASLHLLNVALHITNTILVARFAAGLGLGQPGVVVASSVFLLWPTQVEPVAWSAGVFDVLATTWMLSALLICIRDRPVLGRAMDAALACALAALALFTKESAVALPLLAFIAVAFRPPHRFGSPRQIVLCSSIFCTTALYMCVRIWAHLPIAGMSSVSRYAVKEQLSRTFSALALPLSDQTIHAHPALSFAIAAAVPVLAAASLIQAHRRASGHALALKGLVWCVVAPAPTIGFLFIGAYLDGTRYLYLAALGWGVVLGGLLDAAWDRRYARWATIGVMAALVAGATVEQQRRLTDWRTAASERDRIIAEARRFAGEKRCESISASDLPPRFNGAQLFTNGFAEAVREVLPPSGSSRPCDWAWTGSAFREK